MTDGEEGDRDDDHTDTAAAAELHHRPPERLELAKSIDKIGPPLL